MKTIIRKGKKTDASEILLLIKELAVFERAPNAVIINQESIEKFGFGRNPLFKCFVAQQEEKIVGVALFYQRYSTWKGPTLHLEDLIVTEKMKGKGIGSKLYKAFLKYAHGLGVERVEWTVLEWNLAAIDFYQKSGAKVLSDWRTVQMDKKTIQSYFKIS
tara:strand:+ start:10742 stop:11221 length:480 start_codon:yes stop_codon:yes gene_type:complete